MNNTQSESATIIYADHEMIIDAIKGKLKETDGNLHVIELCDEDFEQSDAKIATWGLMDFDSFVEAEHGEDFIKIEDVAEFDCNPTDIYSAEWEERIDIHSQIETDAEKFRLELQY